MTINKEIGNNEPIVNIKIKKINFKIYYFLLISKIMTTYVKKKQNKKKQGNFTVKYK